MNRREALKLLAGIPFLGLLKPEAVEAPDKFKQAQLDLIETIKKIEPDGKLFFDIVEEPPRLMTCYAPTITQQLGDAIEKIDGTPYLLAKMRGQEIKSAF